MDERTTVFVFGCILLAIGSLAIAVMAAIESEQYPTLNRVVDALLERVSR